MLLLFFVCCYPEKKSSKMHLKAYYIRPYFKALCFFFLGAYVPLISGGRGRLTRELGLVRKPRGSGCYREAAGRSMKPWPVVRSLHRKCG